MRSQIGIVIAAFIAASCVKLVKAQNNCAGRPDGTFINDFKSCDGFYTCVRSLPIPGRCPTGFYFNEDKQICDFSWHVVCLLCRDPEDDDDEAEPPGQNPDGPMRFPIENECRKYTLCSAGRGVLRECGHGLQFSRRSRNCDFEQNVQCAQHVCPNNINPYEPTLVPHPQDCASYYMCLNRHILGGGPIRCTGNLLFNPATRQCDVAANVECEVTNPPLTECPSTGMHYIPSMASCSEYYVCISGMRLGPQRCAHDLIFDVITRACQVESSDTHCILDNPVMIVEHIFD